MWLIGGVGYGSISMRVFEEVVAVCLWDRGYNLTNVLWELLILGGQS